MARPKKGTGEQLGAMLHVRLREAELRLIEAAAKGMTVSEWCRLVLSRAARTG